MNKYSFRAIRGNVCALFYKSLLTCLLAISSPFSLQASQSTNLPWASSLCTGVCIYISSKFSTSYNKKVKEVGPRYKEEKILELVVAKRLGEDEEGGDEDGKALVELYIANRCLSDTFSKQANRGFAPYQKMRFTLDFSDFIERKRGREVRRVNGFSGGRVFSRMSSLKLLTSLLLLSSIPGVGGKVVEDVEFVDQGVIGCAICVAGCCAALGMAEGPACVLHCSIGPCAWVCGAPIP